MSENYYDKLKEIQNKTEVIDAEVVDENKDKITTGSVEQAKDFYEKVFENKIPNNEEQMKQFQQAQYAQQVQFVLKRRFQGLSLLFGIFAVTIIITSIIGLLASITDENIIESLIGINWELTEENIELMKISFMIIYGVQMVLGGSMLYCAYLAKIGHNNALKYGNIITIIAIVFAGLSLEIVNLLILGMIYMNIRATKQFINNNINNFK